MFQRIAPRYDLMNRLMSLGQDERWRRTLVRCVRAPRGGRLLDVGAGTGRIARLNVTTPHGDVPRLNADGAFDVRGGEFSIGAVIDHGVAGRRR